MNLLPLLAVTLVAAPPAPALLPELPAPLGHLGNVIEPVPAGGVPDKTIVATFPSCDPQAIFLLRALGGTARAVEQLQQWLDAAPGLEKKLFARQGQLGDVVKHLADARLSAKRACTPPAVKEGFKLELVGAPKKLCPAPADATTGDFWFFTGETVAAVVNLLPGAPDACRPRLSVVLFDSKGQARVRLHADWGGVSSLTLVGDRCQSVDFVFSAEKQAFAPVLKTCKR